MDPAAASGASFRVRALAWVFLRAFALVVLSAIASVLVLRYVLPSRFEGAGGGLSGFMAWLGDQHPLLVGLAVFSAISEVTRYWSRRLSRRATGTAGVDAGLTRGSARRLLIGLAVASILAFVARSSLVATFRVVGPSMLPTLEVGDRLLVDRMAYGLPVPLSKTRLRPKVPQRGDLVVFPASGLTGSTGSQTVVKRVLGLPGDLVTLEQGSMVINGWRVPACDAGPYVDLLGRLTVRGRLVVEYLGDKTYLTVRRVVEPPFAGYTVKPNEVFVVGDDRGISSDSRLWNERRGAGVPLDMLEGRVTRVLLGARPDGRFDLSRLFAPPLDSQGPAPRLRHARDRQAHRQLSQEPTFGDLAAATFRSQREGVQLKFGTLKGSRPPRDEVGRAKARPPSRG